MGLTRHGEEDERLLSLADTFARARIEQAGSVRYAVARASSEVEEILRLRCRTVVDNGWADPAAFPDGVERDEFDDRAVHVGGRDGENLVACARLVFPVAGHPLPTEKHFGVSLEPQGRVVEVGRVIVVPDHRAADRRIFLGLLAACWLELRAGGFHVMGGDAADWLIQVYRDMGFEIRVIGPGGSYWGEHRYPILMDGLASVESVIRKLGGA